MMCGEYFRATHLPLSPYALKKGLFFVRNDKNLSPQAKSKGIYNALPCNTANYSAPRIEEVKRPRQIPSYLAILCQQYHVYPALHIILLTFLKSII